MGDGRGGDAPAGADRWPGRAAGGIMRGMAAFERKRASYADLEAVPETMVGEILDGELITSPRPGMLHANASSELGAVLRGRFRKGSSGPGGWIFLLEPELHLHGDALVPDLGGWRRARMPEVLDAAASELAPDWVCEVVSPSTERRDRSRKLRIYAREGVGHAWLVCGCQRPRPQRRGIGTGLTAPTSGVYT